MRERVNERETSRDHASRCHMTQRDGRGTHTGDPHRGPTQRGTTQGTQTGDPHRGEGPTEDPPPEGRATQGTHTGHTQTRGTRGPCDLESSLGWALGAVFP